MQRKSLDTNIGVEDYNKKIFNKSMELIFNCKKIPINQLTSLHKHQSIKKKYNAIDQKLQSMLKILRNFTDTEKPTFNNPIELATEILQQTKLQVQIQFRKAQQETNTVKKIKVEETAKEQRPQDKFPDIKVFENYDEHSHQTYLEDGIIPDIKVCESVEEPSDLNNDLLYVDTVEKLEFAIKQMKQFSEVAVDVEHSTKSYQGFTCLIQMSTRTKDYIIDVFPIWSHVQALQEIIGNPNIVKVMHGAEMDTKWLQRDFNIHIVNLFDTHKASRVLGKAKFSYAFLLTHYCAVTTNKIFQRADWRERPLSSQMIKYARIDTHYLLTIFDHLRIELQKQAKSMNLSIADVLKDIQKSSHQVTLSNAQLSSYKTKQLYINLQFEFKNKKQEFMAIETIFSQLSYVAMERDQNFDDLIPKKDLMEAISFIKDIVFNKTSKISKQARIQKIVNILQRTNSSFLVNSISNIKAKLLNIFCQITQPAAIEPKTSFKENKSINQIQKIPFQQSKDQNILTFTRTKSQSIKFNELNQRGLVVNEQNKKVKVTFQPIIDFLSIKYGVQQIKQEDAMGNNQMQSQEDQDSESVKEEDLEEEDEKQGIIEFKRMNPNVIYTIQDPDPEVAKAVSKQQPRKMRKQTEYQNRIRNKTGNIYEMLQNN